MRQTKRLGWLSAGEWKNQPVIIEKETPKRYRVRAVGPEIRLPHGTNGVSIILRCGTVLVPKDRVVFA